MVVWQTVVDETRPHTQQQLAQAIQCVRSWEQQGLIGSSKA